MTDPAVEYEDFLVEIPLTSDCDLSVGDLVEPTVEVSFGSGMVLRRGLVVAIDRDPSQNLLPLFFIVGLDTGIRSPLLLGSLKKMGHRQVDTETFPEIKFSDRMHPHDLNHYRTLLH